MNTERHKLKEEIRDAEYFIYLDRDIFKGELTRKQCYELYVLIDDFLQDIKAEEDNDDV